MSSLRFCIVLVLILCAAPGCETPDPDNDSDGVARSSDCDDQNASIHPGAKDICNDGIDQDCSGADNLDCLVEEQDRDGDGFLSLEDGGEDCNDLRGDIFPGAQEVPYDGIDQDCDGVDLTDVDGDGQPAVVAHGQDCDDEDASIYFGAPEIPYDGIDQDCEDGDLVDVDMDGFLGVPAGGEDCDDEDAAVRPGAGEIADDGVDQNCDGLDNPDLDLDGVASPEDCNDQDASIRPGAPEITCNDIDENCDLYVADRDCDGIEPAPFGDDCDDTNPLIHAGTDELACNAVDEDCDGYLADQDCDGYDALAMGGGDCNDLDLHIRPFAPEFINEIDDNCNGDVDEHQMADDAKAVIDGDPGSLTGTALATGDVDGDGIADLAIGAPEWMDPNGQRTGAVFVLPGTPLGFEDSLISDAKIVIYGSRDGDRCGDSLAMGDVDGDGVEDIIIGSPNALDVGQTRPGKVYVIAGGALVPRSYVDMDSLFSITGEKDGDLFGYSVAFADDVNNDGYGDLLVGAPGCDLHGHTSAGQAYVFLGSEAQTSTTYRDADFTFEGDDEEACAGTYVSGLGDLNLDGVADLGIGSPGYEEGNGHIDIFFGSDVPNNWEPRAHSTLALDADGSTGGGLGPMARAGDVNGDGVDDLVVGAPGVAEGTGLVYVKFGPLNDSRKSLTVTNDSDASFVGETKGARFGAVLATGLLTDDEDQDILIGAPDFNEGRGAIYLMEGRRGTDWAWNRSAAAAVSFWDGSAAGQSLGSAMTMADLNVDGWSDLMSGAPGDNAVGDGAGAVYAFLW